MGGCLGGWSCRKGHLQGPTTIPVPLSALLRDQGFSCLASSYCIMALRSGCAAAWCGVGWAGLGWAGLGWANGKGTCGCSVLELLMSSGKRLESIDGTMTVFL